MYPYDIGILEIGVRSIKLQRFSYCTRTSNHNFAFNRIIILCFVLIKKLFGYKGIRTAPNRSYFKEWDIASF